MTRTIDGNDCELAAPTPGLQRRAERWMDTPARDTPGYWVRLTSRTYAYREHTGDITYWRRK